MADSEAIEHLLSAVATKAGRIVAEVKRTARAGVAAPYGRATRPSESVSPHGPQLNTMSMRVRPTTKVVDPA